MYRKIEEYADYINRLFPQKYDGNILHKKLARTITFQVTDDCNLKCTYCYEINKGHHIMKFETAKKFIDDLLNETANYGDYINQENSPAIMIEFIGGEPFLAIDVINEITDYFINQMIVKHHPWATRYIISICSNGVLYFNPKVQEYIKKHLKHLSFSISIDGNKKLHDACRVFPNGSGSYDIAIKGVEHFTKVLGGHMGSKMTLAPENIQYTFEAVKNLIEYGYTQIFLNCVYEKGWTTEHAKIMYEQLKEVADYLLEHDLDQSIFISMFQEDLAHPKSEDDLDNWCGGTGYMIAVDYKGDIFPCLRYMESSLGAEREPYIIGNVDTGMFANKKQCDLKHCLDCVNRRSESTDECFYCPIATGCGWCSAYNYQEFGTVNKRTTYICEMHKSRALANVYFWNKLYLKHENSQVFHNYMPDEWALNIISDEELKLLTKLQER